MQCLSVGNIKKKKILLSDYKNQQLKADYESIKSKRHSAQV